MTTDDMWYGVLGMKNGCMKYVVCSYVQKESLINLWILLTTEHMSVYTLKLRIGSNAVWNQRLHNMTNKTLKGLLSLSVAKQYHSVPRQAYMLK